MSKDLNEICWARGEGKLHQFMVAHTGLAGPNSHFARPIDGALPRSFLKWEADIKAGVIKDEPDYIPKCSCYKNKS